MVRHTAVTILFLILVGSLSAETSLEEYKSYLGNDLASVINDMGTPIKVLPRRGSVPEEDDCVFLYDNNLQLGIYTDHVWKISFTVNSIDEAESLIKSDPYQRLLWEKGASKVYQLKGNGFPIRLQVHKRDDDIWIHIYRGDL